jgi:serine phosphatase RsbU (regulator of sigma subunit)
MRIGAGSKGKKQAIGGPAHHEPGRACILVPVSAPFDPLRTITATYRQLTAPKAFHYLIVVQGMTIQRAVPITPEPLVLGRDPSRSFHLPDADVSRAHCELRLAEERVLVRDLGSTNGTFLDGNRVTGEQLFPVSSTLRVGKHQFRHELLSPEEVARREEFAKDLERARRYVQALIPSPIEHGPVRTDWCFVPSSVLGGDALGYHELEGGCIALYVLDVCGHGVGSAMHSASVLNALRSRTLPNTDFGEPAQVLRRLNVAFPMENHSGTFFSIFYAVLDPKSGKLTYSSAGHPPALVRGTGGSIRSRLAVKNPPVGTMADRAFEQAEAVLEPGERLYVFSDGVYELCDREGRQRGLADFETALVASKSDMSRGEPRRCYDAACSTAGTDLLDDDFTLLIVERDSKNSP